VPWPPPATPMPRMAGHVAAGGGLLPSSWQPAVTLTQRSQRGAERGIGSRYQHLGTQLASYLALRLGVRRFTDGYGIRALTRARAQTRVWAALSVLWEE
jgi:hypothetical protein